MKSPLHRFLARFDSITILATLLGLCWAGGTCLSGAEKRVESPVGTLVLDVPEDWEIKTARSPRGTVTFEVITKKPREFDGKLTVFPNFEPAADALAKSAREIAEENGKELVNDSVEKKLNLKALGKPGGNQGYYVSLTDAAPKPDEFRLITSGTVVATPHLVVFTLLYQKKDQAELTAAMTAMSTLKFLPRAAREAGGETKAGQLPPGLAQDQEGKYTIQAIGAPFKVRINTAGYKFEPAQAKLKDNGKGVYFLFAPQKAGLPNLSLWIEPPGVCDTLEDCQKRLSAELKAMPQLKTSKQGKFFVFEYENEPFGEMVMTHIRAEYCAGGYWADLHLSLLDRTSALAANKEKLLKALQNIAIEEAK